MSAGGTEGVSFAIAATLALLATPVAIRVAERTEFLDRPRQYRKHASPTPFLGGSAVLAAFLLAGLLAAGASGKLLVPLGSAVGLWLVGTLDDRGAVPPKWRVLAETAAAVGLFVAGLGWSTDLPTAGNVALTIVWVVGLVNAFNLMDNLDGACSTVAAVAAAGIGTLAAIKGQPTVAALAFALSGACAGFLPWNLAGPAKIFLGDGGSMPIGFLVAALAMATARHSAAGNAGILVGALLAGLPILDTALVSLSRARRGVTLVTGGRDHLTHRLLLVLRNPRGVALVLGIGQGVLCLIAIAGYEWGKGAIAGLSFAAFVIGVGVVLVLDRSRWRPAGIAFRTERREPPAAGPESVRIDSG